MTHTTKTIHPFELSGLGLAPFRYVGWERRVGPIRLGNGMEIGAPGQPMGTCQYCGQGIANCMIIESHDKKRFIVGCNCVEKLGRDDNRLASQATRVMAEIRRKQRHDRREQRRKERQSKFEAELQSQRDRNGGLTDREVAEKQREDERRRQAAIHSKNNAWLIGALKRKNQTPFVSDMICDLDRRSLESMSDRCIGILCDIYAKSVTNDARRNSRKYNDAVADFETRAGLID